MVVNIQSILGRRLSEQTQNSAPDLKMKKAKELQDVFTTTVQNNKSGCQHDEISLNSKRLLTQVQGSTLLQKRFSTFQHAFQIPQAEVTKLSPNASGCKTSAWTFCEEEELWSKY